MRARCRFVERRTCRGVAPTVATGATVATCGSWPRPTRRRCSGSVTTPIAAATDGKHGQGKKRHGPRGQALEVPVPVGTMVRGPDGAVLADLADGRGPLAGGRGRPGRAGQCPLPLQPPPGAGLRRAGREGRGALARPRAQAAGRRGPGGAAQLGQEHADLAHLRGASQGGRLPLHHPRAPSRRGPGRSARRRDRVRGGRRPGPGGGSGRGPGPRPPVPAPRRAGPGPGGAARPGPRRRHAGVGAGADPARRAAAATGPSCSSGPGWWWARRPTSAPGPADGRPRAHHLGRHRGGDPRAPRPPGRHGGRGPGRRGRARTGPS